MDAKNALNVLTLVFMLISFELNIFLYTFTLSMVSHFLFSISFVVFSLLPSSLHSFHGSSLFGFGGLYLTNQSKSDQLSFLLQNLRVLPPLEVVVVVVMVQVLYIVQFWFG